MTATGPTQPTNTQRGCRAEQALLAYAAAEGRLDELARCKLAETLVTDLLADFLHFAHAMHIDFARCLETATMHFEAELAEERAS